MKRIATIVNNGRVVGLVHGPDACNQRIRVNGKEWRFDFDEYGGPLWLRKDGQPRECQNPNKAVWRRWEGWHKRWRALKAKPENKPTTFPNHVRMSAESQMERLVKPTRIHARAALTQAGE